VGFWAVLALPGCGVTMKTEARLDGGEHPSPRATEDSYVPGEASC